MRVLSSCDEYIGREQRILASGRAEGKMERLRSSAMAGRVAKRSWSEYNVGGPVNDARCSCYEGSSEEMMAVSRPHRRREQRNGFA